MNSLLLLCAEQKWKKSLPVPLVTSICPSCGWLAESSYGSKFHFIGLWIYCLFKFLGMLFNFIHCIFSIICFQDWTESKSSPKSHINSILDIEHKYSRLQTNIDINLLLKTPKKSPKWMFDICQTITWKKIKLKKSLLLSDIRRKHVQFSCKNRFRIEIDSIRRLYETQNNQKIGKSHW